MFAHKHFQTPSGIPLEPTTAVAEAAFDRLTDIINKWLLEPFNLVLTILL